MIMFGSMPDAPRGARARVSTRRSPHLDVQLELAKRLVNQGLLMDLVIRPGRSLSPVLRLAAGHRRTILAAFDNKVDLFAMTRLNYEAARYTRRPPSN
jgi:hypothetical protein